MAKKNLEMYMKDPLANQPIDPLKINPVLPNFNARIHEGQEAYMKELEKLNSH